MSSRPPAWQTPLRVLWPIAVAIALGLVMHFGVANVVSGYNARILLLIGINITLAVSLTMVNGFTGQFSIGHAGFMAVGGYIAAALVYYGSARLFGDIQFHGGILSAVGESREPLPLLGKGDVLMIVACLVGGLAAAGAGYIVGLPTLRLKGDYLAIVTLGFGEIVRVILQGTGEQLQPWKVEQINQTPLHTLAWGLGGAQGFKLVPPYATLFWVFFVAVVTVAVALRLKFSSAGRAMISIREDEVAAQSMGVNIVRYKVRAFVLSSFFAGVAGALTALDIGSINASTFGFVRSFDIIIFIVLGGLGSVSGAIAAAAILTILPEVLRELHIGPFNAGDYRMIIYSLLLILIMILRPKGLLGIHEIWEFAWFKRLLRRVGLGGKP